MLCTVILVCSQIKMNLKHSSWSLISCKRLLIMTVYWKFLYDLESLYKYLIIQTIKLLGIYKITSNFKKGQ